MKIYADIQQLTPEWHELRLGTVTASRFSSVLAGGKGKTRKTFMYGLVNEIRNRIPIETKTTVAMQRGTEIEPLAREAYIASTDLPVIEVGFVELTENIGCSPDGLVGTEGLLEIKCPNTTTHIETIDTEIIGYKAQIQGQLWVTGRKWCDFVTFDPRHDEPFWCKRIFRDEEYILGTLEPRITKFVAEMLAIVDKKKVPF